MDHTIIIPEGALVTKDGDVIVNQLNRTSAGNTSDIDTQRMLKFSINVDNGMTMIRQGGKQSDIKLFSLDGKIIINTKTSEENKSVPITEVGVFLPHISGKTHKITVK